MRDKRTRYLALVMMLALGLGLWAALEAGTPQRARKGGGGGSLVSGEKTTLVFMREVEKLARDVYIQMYELWGSAIFSNISTSEQRHMDALLNLLNKYGVPDPAQGNGVGEFTDPEVQALHDALVLRGRTSVVEAYDVGKTIEELDIDDLNAAINGTSKTDLLNVYNNLLAASYNHLAAFNSHL